MSSARKLQAVPKPTASAADVEAELTAAQAALSAAGAAVETAKTALDAAPRDASQRSVLREALIMAEEDREKAMANVDAVRHRLNATQRREDEQAARELGARVGQAAQMKAAQAMADEFIRTVGGAAEAFFAKLSEQNLAFRDDAERLNAIWSRLGHGYRIDGVEREQGTGTESIPARVSLDALHHEHFVKQRLEHQHPEATHLKQATRQFLLGAFEFPRTWRLLKQHVASASLAPGSGQVTK